MKYTKKVSVSGEWVKKGEDVKDGDLITIANEGQDVEGEFGVQHVFLVKLANGTEKNLSINQTSLNNLIDAYGEDSLSWIGKQVKVWLITQNVSGVFKKVLYVSHPSADFGEKGFVMPSFEKSLTQPAPTPEEQIDLSNVPF